jgi:hypothetical protein
MTIADHQTNTMAGTAHHEVVAFSTVGRSCQSKFIVRAALPAKDIGAATATRDELFTIIAPE